MSHATSAPGWPVLRGIQTVKEVSYLNMRQASAAAALSKLWSDTFLTNAGIYAAGSSGYSYQGTPNFNVVKDGTQLNKIPLMTGQTTPSGEATANSNYTTYYAWKVFDKDTGTAWLDSTANPHWLRYDFGAGVTKKIVKYTMTASIVGTRSPSAWKFQGSNNGTDWTDLDSQTGITFSNYEKKTFTFSNTTAYRYYQFNISAGGSGGDISIAEAEMMEAAASTASIVSVLALDLAANITQAIMFADVTLGTGTAAYYISTDDGSTWTAVTPETLASVPAGKKIRIKVELTGDAELESWGVAA